MLRLLHTADVHLGARHADLGDRAATQRERQFAAFVATTARALAEKADLARTRGDLFDWNTRPRRSVERAAAQLKRLVDARIRIVIAPGTHDVFDRASIYRAYDLPALAGAVGSDLVTVLNPDHPDVYLRPLDVVVYGKCFPTKRAPHSPLLDFDAAKDERASWHVGVLHAALAIEGKTDGDDVVITSAEIEASHLDYLALGHWHSTSKGRAGRTTYAYSGGPEPVALDQDRAGNVLLVTLDETDGKKRVMVEERKVGKTSFERVQLDAAAVGSQPGLVKKLTERADPDLMLDVELIGVRPDELDLHVEEVESEMADRFLKLRIRDRAVSPLPEGPVASPDTVLGAFVRDLEAQIAELEAADDDASANELRDALRLGRLLLSGAELTL